LVGELEYACLGKEHFKSYCTKLTKEQRFIPLSRSASMKSRPFHLPAEHASPMRQTFHVSKKNGLLPELVLAKLRMLTARDEALRLQGVCLHGTHVTNVIMEASLVRMQPSYSHYCHYRATLFALLTLCSQPYLHY